MLQRRYDHYRIIYTRKILMGLVPDVGIRLRKDSSARNGQKIEIPSRKNQLKIRAESFQVRGPTLYNCLPESLRMMEGSMEVYKTKLDEFLSLLPDRPRLDEGSLMHCNELDTVIREWKWNIHGV